MPFPFTLPTTSSLSYTDHLLSNTHPSLPSAATTCRSVLRDALKKHKRLPASSQPFNLQNVLRLLNDYIPYLLALDAGLSGRAVAGEELDLALRKEVEVEWRPTLTSSLPGREPARVKLTGLDAEIHFVLSTLASTYMLLARSQLHTLYDATTPAAEQRTAAVSSAMKYFLQANSIYSYLVSRPAQFRSSGTVVDISTPVLDALAALALAEATLVTVLKDDPYPVAINDDRNANNKDWMYKAPEIPKVRAHLFARLCLAAAEHAARAQGTIDQTSKLDEALIRYLKDLQRTSRAKACRFLAIDAEISGRTGEGIAWLRAAKKELGFAGIADESRKPSAFSKLRKDWAEKREDRKIVSGGEWGGDAGKFEEGRIVELLEKKWVKLNDTVKATFLLPTLDIYMR